MIYIGQAIAVCPTSGAVTVKEGVTLDDASRQFWDAVEAMFEIHKSRGAR
jgi:hypothetical protein